MNDKLKSLGDEVRALSAQERVRLIEDILESLDRADPDIDRLWVVEARDRLAAYRRGELVAKDFSEIIAKYRP